MIPRPAHEARLRDLLSDSPAHAARLAAPQLALEALTGLVVLDDVQLRPDLFPLLRVLADRPGTPARRLLLGSASPSPSLLRDASESLAGRLAFLGLGIPAATLRRLWSMLAHWHGQLLSASELGRSLGVADTTVRRYLDLLQGTFVVHLLRPWHANLGKRQDKSPRIYLTDPGLLHAFFGVADHAALLGHPKAGASWEGFGIAAVLDLLGVRPGEAFFWRTQDGAELDLLVTRGGRRRGFEFKLTATPSTTRSMHIALSVLELDDLTVIHAGEGCFPMADRIRAVALADAPEALASP